MDEQCWSFNMKTYENWFTSLIAKVSPSHNLGTYEILLSLYFPIKFHAKNNWGCLALCVLDKTIILG